MAVSESAKVTVWLRCILKELCINQNSTIIMQDYARAMTWAAGHRFEEFQRSKHIELRCHHTREIIGIGELRLQKTNTDQMTEDCLTKPLNAQQVKKQAIDHS